MQDTDNPFLHHVIHRIKMVLAVISGNHHENISFHLINSLYVPVIFRCMWLCNNPIIDWSSGALLGWRPYWLQGMLIQCLFVHLDDILIISQIIQEHVHHVRTVPENFTQ